jgi:hypothetical protein
MDLDWNELIYFSLLCLFLFSKTLDEIQNLSIIISKITDFKHHSRFSRKQIFAQIRQNSGNQNFKIPKIMISGSVKSENDIVYSLNCSTPLIFDKSLPRLKKSLFFSQQPLIKNPFELVVESSFLKLNNIQFNVNLDSEVDLRYALRVNQSKRIFEDKSFFKKIYVSLASVFGINISYGLTEKVLQIRAGEKLYAMGDLIYNAEKKILEMKAKKFFTFDPEIYLNRLNTKSLLSLLKLSLYLGISMATLVWIIRKNFFHEKKVMINDINEYENKYSFLEENKTLKCDKCKLNMKDIMMGDCGHIVSCNGCWKDDACKICGIKMNGKIRLFPV